MHETGLVRSLVRRIEQSAAEAGATRVLAVRLRLGALCPFSAEHLREHFAEAARGTLAAGAGLEVETSQDVADPHAQDVVLVGMTLDVPEAEA